MRGLKQNKPEGEKVREGRIFYRCVDWNNLFWRQVLIILAVASFTDAWIETTLFLRSNGALLACRIFYRCVDWNNHVLGNIGWSTGRIFYRCVDWNHDSASSQSISFSRIFYRCVDWNEWRITQNLIFSSHLLQMRGLKHLRLNREHHGHGRIFYRCVDWNCDPLKREKWASVASFTDAWIETASERLTLASVSSHLLQMRGLKLCFRERFCISSTSHLLQMRGLKLDRKSNRTWRQESHLLQMRGLKLILLKLKNSSITSHLLQMRGLKP